MASIWLPVSVTTSSCLNSPECSNSCPRNQSLLAIHTLHTAVSTYPRSSQLFARRRRSRGSGGLWPCCMSRALNKENVVESTSLDDDLTLDPRKAMKQQSTIPDKELADEQQPGIMPWLYPSKEELPDDVEMSLFDHLEELRQRLFVSVAAVGVAILGCFAFAKDLIILLESPANLQGVRFLQLSPGEYFFTTLKVSGYFGLLIGSPVILYEIIAFVLPGLTRSERKFLGPIVFGSSFLFYAGLAFSYSILAPAALKFFVSYSEGVVESFWSIDQYFEFVLVLMFSTGLSFQVPVIQLLLGQTRIVTGDQMLSIWRYVVVGAVIAAAVLTPSTDPLTQVLLAGPLIALYIGGALLVKAVQPQVDANTD